MYRGGMKVDKKTEIQERENKSVNRTADLSQIIGNYSMILQCCGGEKARPARNRFTAEEDGKLKAWVSQLGSSSWVAVAEQMPNRNARQCRERWKHHLDRSIKASWTKEEDGILKDKYGELGSKWGMIAKFLPGKKDDDVKNRYNHFKGIESQRKGREYEQKKLNELLDKRELIVDFQTPIKVPGLQGMVIADAIVSGTKESFSPSILPPKIIIKEFKSSSRAPLTTNQKAGYSMIKERGGTIMSGPYKGQMSPPGTDTEIVRQV